VTEKQLYGSQVAFFFSPEGPNHHRVGRRFEQAAELFLALAESSLRSRDAAEAQPNEYGAGPMASNATTAPATTLTSATRPVSASSSWRLFSRSLSVGLTRSAGLACGSA